MDSETRKGHLRDQRLEGNWTQKRRALLVARKGLDPEPQEAERLLTPRTGVSPREPLTRRYWEEREGQTDGLGAQEGAPSGPSER